MSATRHGPAPFPSSAPPPSLFPLLPLLTSRLTPPIPLPSITYRHKFGVVRRYPSVSTSCSTVAHLTTPDSLKMADTEAAPQVNYYIPATTATVGPESDFEANFVRQTMAEWLEAYAILLEVYNMIFFSIIEM